MKCFNHPDLDAVAACVYCGAAVCPKCATRSESARIVCSARCSESLGRIEQAVTSMQSKNLTTYRIIGYLLFSSAFLIGSFGLLALREAIWQLAFLCFGVVAIFLVVGVFVFYVAKRKEIGYYGG